MGCALGFIPKKALPNQRPQIFFPMFFSRNFIILDITFRCRVHVEFFFVYGGRYGLKFIVLHVGILSLETYTFKQIIRVCSCCELVEAFT